MALPNELVLKRSLWREKTLLILSVPIALIGVLLAITQSSRYWSLAFIGGLVAAVSALSMAMAGRHGITLRPDGIRIGRGIGQLFFRWSELRPFSVERIWFKRWVVLSLSDNLPESTDTRDVVVRRLMRGRRNRLPLPRTYGRRPEQFAEELERWRRDYGGV